MKWFDTFVSNTLGGTGNQLWFSTEGQVRTGRVYYKIFSGGTFRYSLLFSNIIDSTFTPESGSRCNQVCHEWELLGLRVGICREANCETATEPESWRELTFGGCREKTVMPGEFFTTDPVMLDTPVDGYLCCEITFRGDQVPCHKEVVLPAFVKRDGQWIPEKFLPVPGMVGCDRKVAARIGFLGDSITQGIGTPHNGYTHWSALVSQAVGDRFSFWNLGLGRGRGQDAATDGAWLFKARQMDGVVVAFGTNDISRGRTLEQMKEDMTQIVDSLKAEGIRVFLLSVPPYSWQEEKLERWLGINEFITRELFQKVDGFLDIAPLLTDPQVPGRALHGNHPNEEGCRIWAEAMLPAFREFLGQWE